MSNDRESALSRWLDSPVRWTIEIWVWSILTPIVVALCVFFPHLWTPISVVYVAVVSNYALVLTAAGARQSSLARIAASKDGLTKEEIRRDLIAHTDLTESS